MADGGEHGVGGVAFAAFEIAAAEVTFGLQVADHRFDRGSASQLALDHTEDAALLAGDEDPARVWCLVAAISLIDVDALDLAAGELLGVLDDGRERVAVVRVARERFGVQHELAARGAGVGGDDRSLDTELVRRVRLALADALDLGSVEGIELPPALALLLRVDLVGARERPFQRRFDLWPAGDLAAQDVADDAAAAGCAAERKQPMVPLELLGVGRAPRSSSSARFGHAGQIGLPQLHPVLLRQLDDPS